MKSQILLAVVVFFFLGGCSLAPKYQQPQAPIPDKWPKGEAYKDAQATYEATTATELSWREFFADEQLSKIIEMALDHNRDLRLASLNVERARALYGIQRAELFPSVDAAGSGSKERRSACLLYTSPSPRDRTRSRMPSSA